MISRIKAYYWEARYRLLKRKWDKGRNGSVIDCDVLMFHHISDAHVDIDPTCQSTVAEFKAILDSRINNGYTYIGIEQIEDIINNHKSGKHAVVTFDDVPHNFITTAYPILKEYNIPFTLFITTSFLTDPEYLSESDIVTLSHDRLCTIGAHTVTHPMLRKSEDPFSEMLQSKQTLEKILGKPVKYLAYPFGRQSSISHKVQRLAQKAGFSLAFSTIQTSINDRSARHPFFLPRVIK